MRRQNVLILAFITIALGIGYFQIAVPLCLYDRAGCLGYPVTPPLPLTAPGKYRIFWTTLETWIAPTVGQSDPQILLVDTLLEIVCIVVTIPALFSWLKRWTNPDRAMLGVMVFAAVNLVAYHLFFRGGGIPVEAALVCLALAWLDRKWWLFIPLVVIGATNRETSLVLVGLYAAYHGYKGLKPSLMLLVIYIGITAGLHIVLGGAEHQQGGLVGTYLYNVENLQDGILTNLILVPLVIGVVAGYRSAPVQLKRMCWVALIYAAAIVVGGAVNETNRLVLPMLPLVIPVILNAHSLMSSTVV